MQSWYLSKVKESDFLLFFMNILYTLHALPKTGKSDEEL